MTTIKAQQPVLYSSSPAVIQSASYKDITLRSKRPDSWAASQVLFAWISDAAARDQGLESIKHDLFQLAQRSSCGVALYHAVVAKMQDIKDAWDEAGQLIRYNKNAEYDARMNDYNTGKTAFEKWIKRWAIQTSFIKQKHDPNGHSICTMETVIVPGDDLVMATLQPIRTSSQQERRSSTVSQTSQAVKGRRSSSTASVHANRRGSQGGVLL